MMDKRELILARLLVVSAAVDGVKKAVRNKKAVSEEDRPSVMVFDADEDADDAEEGRARPPHAPNFISMTPEIFLLLSAVPENVGTDINTFRAKFLKAVLMDQELRDLVGTNGEIRYKGCATGLAQGRTMEGEMGIFISFTYPLNPSQL